METFTLLLGVTSVLLGFVLVGMTSVLLVFILVGVTFAPAFPNLTDSVRRVLLGNVSHCESSTSKKQEG